MPVRIRLERTRGWRKPAGVVVVSRPTRWGNPFAIGVHGRTREQSVREYREALLGGRLDVGPDDVRRELRGRDLACWCPLDEPCHADVLLDVANG